MSDQGASSTISLGKQAALRQLFWIGLSALTFFIALLLLLGWMASRTGGGRVAGRAVDVAAGAITLSYPNEPPQLDSTRATDVHSSYVLGHVMEGLLRLDEHGEISPGVAERWEIRPEGATFYLRENALWSDGEPVTAHDFVFSWRNVVDPGNASEYAFIMYALKNAEAINKGDLPIEALGVTAKDDRTLEVRFERPVAYFDKLVTFKTYFPIRRDFYESRTGRYGADAEDLLFNGPFVLSRWVHGAHLQFRKNVNYWNSQMVRLNLIDIPYITTDSNAVLNLYKDQSVAMAGQSLGLDPEQLSEVLAQGWPLQRFNEGAVFFLEFNHRPGRISENRNLRKALQLAFDSGALVNQVIKLPGYLPGESLFPTWLRGVDGYFRKEYPAPTIRRDLQLAREHLELAKKELGLKELPPIALLADDRPLTVRITDYLQELYARDLGLDVRIDRQIFKQRLAKMRAGEFDIVVAGWSPDFDDPLTFGDLFASWNLNNRGRYESAELDEWVRQAMGSLEPKVRMDAFGEIQRTLTEDAVIIPMYERGQVFVSDKRLKGVVRRVVGTDPDFTHAYLIDE